MGNAFKVIVAADVVLQEFQAYLQHEAGTIRSEKDGYFG